MSKRKIDQLYGDGITGEGGGVTKTSGWSDLPPELVRRVGQLQDDARGLAGMERTCKSWRTVVLEGNDGVKMTDDKPCLWRDLALAEHPNIRSIAEVLMDASCAEQDGPTNFSWKGLIRSHRQAFKSSEKPEPPPYQPRTKLTDYIFTVEFHTSGDDDNDKKVLFTTSGRGLVTPQLWDQEVGVVENDYGYLRIRPKGALDPELKKRLGDDPFDDDQVYNMRARVTVTRRSDMSMVELVSDLPVPKEEGPGFVDYCDGEYITFQDFSEQRQRVPQGCMIVDAEDIVAPVGNGCLSVYECSLRLSLDLEPQTGRVTLEIIRSVSGESIGILDEEDPKPDGALKYLEVQCPWPADAM